MNFLQLSGVSKRFGGVQALAKLDFDLERGEVHSLVGGNGSGKSTMIKIISGVLIPDPGSRIVIEGHSYSHLTAAESSRLGVQVIYQDLSLFPNLSVAENIGIGLHRGGVRAVNWAKICATAKAAMERIDVNLDPNVRVSELSIASRQLVAICRAVAADARLLIMDEPTASLTRHEVNALLALTHALKAKGITILFVSHRFDEVLEIADRVTIVRDGVKLGVYDAKGMTERELVTLMAGRTFDYETGERAIDRSRPLLGVRALGREGQYEDVSFDLSAGEVLGITGLLGAGRTELALSLFGMNPWDRGEVVLDGKAVRFSSNAEAIAQGVAYVPEDRLHLSLVLNQSIGGNIALPVLNALTGAIGLLSGKRRAALIRKWISDLAIKAPQADDAVRTLSGGNQQRVVIAKWLATKPRILILDSPTVGVDFQGKDGIYRIVKQLAESGVAVILISDEIPEVLYHCDRILVMRQGRITGEYAAHHSCEAQLKEAVYV